MAENSNVDTYINEFPVAVQQKLQELRSMIKKAAPEAEEVISYKMPAYKLHGMLVYFAGYDNHIGFYPTPSAIEKFKPELCEYKQAKGSIQFPISEPLPADLIKRMVQFRVTENLEKESINRAEKKKK